jgi:hypothetical protein
MKSSKLFLIALSSFTVLQAAAAYAAHVDMTDPRRALGREDDVRVDAQLVDDNVSSGSPVGITYQIQNFTKSPIAVAGKMCDISYDTDSRTITVSVGSEVPKDGEMPRLVTIGPGEMKTFTCGAILHVTTPVNRSPFTAVPQFVQIKVNVLRDLLPFRPLIDQQAHTAEPIELTDQQFDQWLESNDTIMLNAIPVHFTGAHKGNMSDASQRGNGGGLF